MSVGIADSSTAPLQRGRRLNTSRARESQLTLQLQLGCNFGVNHNGLQLLSALTQQILGVNHVLQREHVGVVFRGRSCLRNVQAVVSQSGLKDAFQLGDKFGGLVLVNRLSKLSTNVSQSVLTGLILAEVVHAVHEASGAIRLVLSRSGDPLTRVVPGCVISPCRGAVHNLFVWLEDVEERQLNASAGDVVQASISCQHTRLDEQATLINGLVQVTSKWCARRQASR